MSDLDTEQPSPERLGQGLQYADHGLRGLTFETTLGFGDAVARHETVLAYLDNVKDAAPGPLVLMYLLANEAVLDLESLRTATSNAAALYASGQTRHLEWPLEDGWRDRRELSEQTVVAIKRNAGNVVCARDWRNATEILVNLHGLATTENPWTLLLGDAAAWWYQHLSAPLLGHAVRLRPYQVLPRVALARRVTQRPQLPDEAPVPVDQRAVEVLSCTRACTRTTATLDGLVLLAGQLARARVSAAEARDSMTERIDLYLPIAAREGRAQVIVLGAIRHAVVAGGVNGRLLAPVTLYDYLVQSVQPLLAALVKQNLDGLDGEGFWRLYSTLLDAEEVEATQTPKISAFLSVFHRYLVIAGFDPLPRGLHGDCRRLPPAATVVWPHELEAALEYVAARAPTARIRLQASLGLVLGYWEPIRTEELGCVRIEDIHRGPPMYLVVYPRRTDGITVAPSTCRQSDIHDLRLKTLLLDLVRERLDADHADIRDVLLGEPGKPRERHAEVITFRLMKDALVYATGDPLASYYDLRHTAFSREALPVLAGQRAHTDVVMFRHLSANGGHAGPESTRAYIHWIEEAMASMCRAGRPRTWF